MTRVAVFGGGGFIGSHLCRRLLNTGRDVVAIDTELEKLGELVTRRELHAIEMDITQESNRNDVNAIVSESDLVVDLIAYANPQQYVDRPIDVVELNLFENLKIVEDCIEHDKRLVQFSTCEVYGMMAGRESITFEEDSSNLILGPVGNQRWIYSCAKQLLERMVYAYGDEGELEYTIVRPFNFIGPKMDYLIKSPDEGTPRVFASFMSSLLYDHPMYLVDGGRNRRTFTHIEDAVDALEIIIDNEGGQFDDELVNVGSPENETTIEGFAELMRDIYVRLSPDGELPELIDIPGEEFYGEGYEDCERRIPDISKLEATGWEPKYDLEELLEDTMAYYIDKYESRQDRMTEVG